MHTSKPTIAEYSPLLTSLLCNPADASITIGSARKVDWTCPNCGTVVRQRSVNKVALHGIPCPFCNKGVSRPEKIVTSALEQAGLIFYSQASFPWSGKRRYDFYLPENSSIIEVHGAQHYGHGFVDLSGFSLEDQKRVDSIKKSLALDNGIKNYFVIDASDTSVGPIIDQLEDVFQELSIDTSVNRLQCEAKAVTDYVTQAAQLWNDGLWSSEIANRLHVAVGTAVDYLHIAADAGLCDYTPRIAHLKSQAAAVEKLKRRVKCVTTGREFSSLRGAAREYQITSTSNIIRSCTSDGRLTAGEKDGIKLIWQYI